MCTCIFVNVTHECYAIENMSTFPMSLWVPLCNTSSTVSYLSRGTRQEGRIFHETKKKNMLLYFAVNL